MEANESSSSKWDNATASSSEGEKISKGGGGMNERNYGFISDLGKNKEACKSYEDIRDFSHLLK